MSNGLVAFEYKPGNHERSEVDRASPSHKTGQTVFRSSRHKLILLITFASLAAFAWVLFFHNVITETFVDHQQFSDFEVFKSMTQMKNWSMASKSMLTESSSVPNIKGSRTVRVDQSRRPASNFPLTIRNKSRSDTLTSNKQQGASPQMTARQKKSLAQAN